MSNHLVKSDWIRDVEVAGGRICTSKIMAYAHSFKNAATLLSKIVNSLDLLSKQFARDTHLCQDFIMLCHLSTDHYLFYSI